MPAPRIDTAREARIVVVCGASGSGKSAWVKQQIEGAGRVLVFDPDDEYHGQGFERITRAAALVEAIAQPAGRFCFVAGGPVMFDFWARAAFAWGQCVAVAEETAGVTSPTKAPPGWHTLVSRGRKRGIEIYGVTQRPSESDKTIVGNSTLIHCGQMTRAKDRAYMAAELDVPRARLDALQPLEWIERDMRTHEIRQGKMDFSGKACGTGRGKKAKKTR